MGPHRVLCVPMGCYGLLWGTQKEDPKTAFIPHLFIAPLCCPTHFGGGPDVGEVGGSQYGMGSVLGGRGGGFDEGGRVPIGEGSNMGWILFLGWDPDLWGGGLNEEGGS